MHSFHKFILFLQPQVIPVGDIFINVFISISDKFILNFFTNINKPFSEMTNENCVQENFECKIGKPQNDGLSQFLHFIFKFTTESLIFKHIIGISTAKVNVDATATIFTESTDDRFIWLGGPGLTLLVLVFILWRNTAEEMNEIKIGKKLFKM